MGQLKEPTMILQEIACIHESASWNHDLKTTNSFVVAFILLFSKDRSMAYSGFQIYFASPIRIRQRDICEPEISASCRLAAHPTLSTRQDAVGSCPKVTLCGELSNRRHKFETIKCGWQIDAGIPAWEVATISWRINDEMQSSLTVDFWC